jgi:antibiotic biosynthesis monooxygenase (ABM) superfamily enzyme
MLRKSLDNLVSSEPGHVPLSPDNQTVEIPPRPTEDGAAGATEEQKTTNGPESKSTVCSIVANISLKDSDCFAPYEAIFKEMGDFCHANFTGHIYSGIVEYNSKTAKVVSVHRFDNMAHLQSWMTSEEELVNLDEAQVDVIEAMTPAHMKLGSHPLAINALVYSIVLPISMWIIFPVVFKVGRKWLTAQDKYTLEILSC